jgi:hypothetical protein
MYVSVSTSGQISFRYDYRIHGRRETLTIGRYGDDGITLAEARERCTATRKIVSEGISPALEKQFRLNGPDRAQWRGRRLPCR